MDSVSSWQTSCVITKLKSNPKRRKIYEEDSDRIRTGSGIAFGHSIVLAPFVPMPKTAMDKNYSFILWQNNIWIAGQFSIVKPESESHSVKH